MLDKPTRPPGEGADSPSDRRGALAPRPPPPRHLQPLLHLPLPLPEGEGGEALQQHIQLDSAESSPLVSNCCCGAPLPSPSGRGRGRCRRGWRCRGGEDLDARAPLLSAGLPAPSPGGLVGLSSSHHPQCHYQLTVTITGDGHASLLACFSQPEKCP